ncbi:hypothetical protein I6F30_24910 [Bradyrhizobium sp. NBAIM20]|uniref:hypothetical protein n=1 Tax=unclassified Bradyrhizobium TaxID=2631580 RepID=UPI001CD27070|nr:MULTISPECIES: hypothetical protein [unclassified Bradyrhizobium]MCA1414366.1 hypothetical protein [Bradyrhizobium sp. NBAIM20]MCA1465622.1 hypothetical protein [Bradyrhizobium sp. NBAIM18]
MAIGHPRRARGLLAASLAAWSFFMIVATMLPLLAGAVSSLIRSDTVWPTAGEIFGPIGFMAAVGLPTSLVICFALGYPAWKVSSACGLTTRWDAIKIGAVIGAALYLLVAVGFHVLTYIKGSSFSYSQGGVLLTKDSLPTLQGIVFDLFLMLFYAADGAVAGLAAWLTGGGR